MIQQTFLILEIEFFSLEVINKYFHYKLFYIYYYKKLQI